MKTSDREMRDWLKQKLGRRRYWFWTIAAKVLPARVLAGLLNRIPDDQDREGGEGDATPG